MAKKPVKIDTSNLAKLADAIADYLDASLSGDPSVYAPLPKNFSVKKNLYKAIVTKSMSVLDSEGKKVLTQLINSFRTRYNSTLGSIFTGDAVSYKTYETISSNMKARKYSPTSIRGRRWIEQVWGGDWYSYKRQLASRRLVRTGKKDRYGKDIYNVYGGKLNNERQEASSGYYFNVGQFKAGDRAKEYNRTVRSKGAVSKAKDIENTSGTGLQGTKYSVAKVSKRMDRLRNRGDITRPDNYAVARAVELATELRNKQKKDSIASVAGYQKKRGSTRNMYPYVRTGRFGTAVAHSFTIETNKLTSKQTDESTLTIKIPIKFSLSKLSPEHRRIYMGAPLRLKQLYIAGAGMLVSEMIQEVDKDNKDDRRYRRK